MYDHIASFQDLLSRAEVDRRHGRGWGKASRMAKVGPFFLDPAAMESPIQGPKVRPKSELLSYPLVN